MKKIKRFFLWFSILLIAYSFLSSLWATQSDKWWKYAGGGYLGEFCIFDNDSNASCSWPVIYVHNQRVGYFIGAFLDEVYIYSDDDKEFGVYLVRHDIKLSQDLILLNPVHFENVLRSINNKRIITDY